MFFDDYRDSFDLDGDGELDAGEYLLMEESMYGKSDGSYFDDCDDLDDDYDDCDDFDGDYDDFDGDYDEWDDDIAGYSKRGEPLSASYSFYGSSSDYDSSGTLYTHKYSSVKEGREESYLHPTSETMPERKKSHIISNGLTGGESFLWGTFYIGIICTVFGIKDPGDFIIVLWGIIIACLYFGTNKCR